MVPVEPYHLFTCHLPYPPVIYRDLPPVPGSPFALCPDLTSRHSSLTNSYSPLKNQLRSLPLEEAFRDLHRVRLHVLALGAQQFQHIYLGSSHIWLELFMLKSFLPITPDGL